MKRKILSVGTALFLSSLGASVAWASNFQLTSAGNTVLDGIYISPYTASIDGVPTVVICDDFADEVGLNEAWQTTMSTVANLAPNVKWATDPGVSGYIEQQSYNEAAWLAGQLLSSSNPTQLGQISYAIWAVFDPTGVQNWLTAYHDTTTYNAIWGSGGLLSQAAANSGGDFSNVLVYTAVANSQPAGYGPPQEFLAVKTPEPSSLAILGVDFTCLGIVVAFLRRRGVIAAAGRL